MEYKIGLHVHTTRSDGKLSPEEVARLYKSAGYDAIAVTDHWKYYPEGELEGLRIISGCEYNLGVNDTADGVMHIVGVGMKEEPELPGKTASRQEVIDAIKEKGGMAVLAHPAWSLNSLADVTALHGFDMLEIYNTVSGTHQSTRPYSGYIVDILANHGIVLPLTATDDAHYYDGTDEARSYVIADCRSLAVEDILEAIRSRRFYASQGPELHVRREGDKIIADCSECVEVSFLSNISFAPDRVRRGEGLTHEEYTLKPVERWARVEVRDAEGKEAWSNIIQIQEN